MDHPADTDTPAAGPPEAPRDTLTHPSITPEPDTDPRGRQFLPGTRFGTRWRIVELLGSGGMGEVYRADDLHLGQTVALKFLPRHLSEDASALARLRNEVRVARTVSHPNVCRVYDIAEVDGRYFLSMEYVDGEDLASVLRRLGRPTAEKSLQIARQLCAGLAAAHEAGVLHRDLKPSNVMIDGKGRVRITDFGLAGVADEIDDASPGTPGYMAPEQLDGRAVSARSDLYSLGVVLYELFTGKPAFDAVTRSDLRRQQRRDTPPHPSWVVTDIDPAVESIVVRCLDKDPGRRPASALEVAAALPGGDPLTDTLAAGETPSPDMVAAAGGQGAMRPLVAVACLVAILGGIALVGKMNERVTLYHLAPPEKPPLVLADRAQELLRSIGHTVPAVDRAQGIDVCRRYLEHVAEHDSRPERWDDLAARRPTPYWFWYRESPVPMVPQHLLGRVSQTDPEQSVAGMAYVQLDGAGRLLLLEIVPPQHDDSPPFEGQVDYAPLFAAAGLGMSAFRPARPEWNPAAYADERRAWDGHFPGQPETPIRIEAASYKGRPVYFHLDDPYHGPWREPEQEQYLPGQRLTEWTAIALLLTGLVAAPLFARRNLRLGCGDRRGAWRLGGVVLGLSMLTWVICANHAASFSIEFVLAVRGLGVGLIVAIWVGCAYLALEPYARRLWPESMITWTRVLLGRFTDPRVGRDVLIGGVAGVSVILLQRLELWVPAALGATWRTPWSTMLDPGRLAVCKLIDAEVLAGPLFIMLLVTGLRFLLRRTWLAMVVAMLLMLLLDAHWQGAGSGVALISAAIEGVAVWVILLFVLGRFGLFAFVVAFFFMDRLQALPVTLDPSQWYAGTTLLVVGVLGALTLYGLRVSLGPRLGGPLGAAAHPAC